MKGIGIVRKLYKALPQHSLIKICKSLLILGYGDIIYGQPNKGYLNQKIERIQYNATLAITGAVIGTYQSRLNNELDS